MDRLLAIAGRVDGAGGYGLVHVEVAVADLEVVAALRVRAGPGLVVDGRALAAEVRQGDQVTGLASLTLWKAPGLHCTTPAPSFRSYYRVNRPEYSRGGKASQRGGVCRICQEMRGEGG